MNVCEFVCKFATVQGARNGDSGGGNVSLLLLSGSPVLAGVIQSLEHSSCSGQLRRGSCVKPTPHV